MSSSIFCVFGCENVDDKILLLTEQKLQQCHEKLRVRRALQMKYGDIVLPDHVTEFHGYHSVCCKNFMAITKKYQQKYDELQKFEESTKTPASFTSLSAPSTSSTSNIDQQCFPVEEQKVTGEINSINEASSRRNAERPTDFSSFSTSTVGDQETSGEQDNVKRICFFCNKTRKVSNYRVLPLYTSKDEKLRNNILVNAIGLNDQEMKNRVKSLGVTDTVHYHNPCKTLYLNKYLNAPKHAETDWHRTRKLHGAAYAEVCYCVEENIIKKNQLKMLQYLTDIYNEVLEKLHHEEFGVSSVKYTSQQLLDKLVNTYGDRIQIITLHQKKIIGPSDGCAIDEEMYCRLEEDELVGRVALILRKQVLRLNERVLPSDSKICDLIAGEGEVPIIFQDFMKLLLCGADSKTYSSPDRVAKIKSITQDIIDTVFNG
ncbi:hypothetical protein PV328_000752 [Microctonus aethiopoides]|uniref:Uncharacterized protein n=1 Tax=Microctonus aethiopoides TaxID=144406 RepID=A0AA39KWS4_9HYME|nr:hypothetical protein PV328_000752 [Microctonus aethiopoides]